MKAQLLIRLFVPLLLALGCSPISAQLTVDQYVSIQTGTVWEYSVQIPQATRLPFAPVTESPQGLICTSVHSGTGSFAAGQLTFSITVGKQLSSTPDLTTWSATIDTTALRFFFLQVDPPVTGGKKSEYELRLRTVSGGLQLELVLIQYLGSGDPWRLYRILAT